MWGTIKRFFTGFFNEFWDVVQKIFNGARETFCIELWGFALQTVTNLANVDLNNSEKRGKAFRLIVEEAMKRGTDYREHWINLIIEIALSALKDKVSSESSN